MNSKPHLDISASEIEPDNNPDLDDLSSTERRRWVIINTPTDNCKYLHIWRRVRTKLFIRIRMLRLNKDIQLFGTSTVVESILNQTRTKLVPIKTEIKRSSSSETELITPPACILLPDHTFKNVWNAILALLLIYTATIMPFRLAFVDGDSYDGWWYLDIVIDTLFFIDILVNINSAYLDNEGQLITDRCKIFIKYLKTWLLLDIIACVPFNLIGPEENNTSSSGETGNYNNLVRLIRLPRLYRLLRISRIFKMIKHYKNNDLIEKINEFLSVKHSNL
jgi:hypothetical protein